MRKRHIVKAEITAEEKAVLQQIAEKEKRSVKKQIEWYIQQAVHIEKQGRK
tara:strand:+ start:167 stop:319 length:153 start_codon:yes stop_codon:yes gene_type:complete